jgi:hypothetical protein
MTDIAVTPTEPDRFGVEVTEGDTVTSHRIAVPTETLDEFAVSGADREQVVRQTFAFLLEREPATSIEREFTLDDVSRYFPEFPEELQRRVGASDATGGATGDGDGGLSDEAKETLEADAAERNPDETTRREALELDLMEQGRSDEGEEIGDEMD